MDGSSRVDFSHLPEVTLVEILSYLTLEDRYHASCTCQNMYLAFNHPSLWRYADIRLFGSTTNFYNQTPFIPKKYYMMVKTFGRFFQNLSLSISGFMGSFSDEWNEIISELGKQCRLETLTLEIGQLTSHYHLDGLPPFKSDMVALLSFVEHAFRLKSFNLQSWPMFPSTLSSSEQNIFDALMKNDKLKDIEELSLFWCKETKWTERLPILPAPEYTNTMTKHFRNISHLGLRSIMINEEVIKELSSSRRARMKTFKIFVNYSPHYEDFRIPEISSEVWKTFCDANPEAEVECTIMPRVPNLELSNLLKPETPVSVINIMRYSRCDGQLISSFADRYGKRLRRFVCYCDSSDCDRELIELATKSPRLNEFLYHGQISYKTVIRLAEIRGQKWKLFEVLEKAILPNSSPNENDAIAQNEDGQYYLVDLMRFHQPEEMLNVALKQMSKEVSKMLGHFWLPQAKQN